jgi:hypothetical protein
MATPITAVNTKQAPNTRIQPKTNTNANAAKVGIDPNSLKSIGDKMKKNKAIVSILLQVFVGLVVAWLIYIIALRVMKIDKLVIDTKFTNTGHTKVKVIEGFVDSATSLNFNTLMPVANNFVPIQPSVNTKGGAQFSYSFWLHKDTNADVAGKVIFLKGDNKKYNFTIRDNTNSKAPIVERLNETMVFCPMIKYSADGNGYEIEFNTLNRYDEKVSVNKVTSADNAYRNNLLTTLNATWHLISVSFEDNIPINDFESGIAARVYINDVLYKTGRIPSALKQNHGDLYLFPNDKNPMTGVKVSDFTYYNYVLSEDDIRQISQAGATTSYSSLTSIGNSNKPPVLSDYNKLDIYNM